MTDHQALVALTYVVQALGYLGIAVGLLILIRSGPRRNTMTDHTTGPTPVQEHAHIYEDRWYPLDKKRIRRVCVLPGCHHVEVKAATA